MKPHFIIAMLVLMVQVISNGQEVSYDPKDWPRHTLKLSSNGTLKDVFDSGIIPFRVPGTERSQLRFKHSNLIVETPQGQSLPELIVEYADLQVKPTGLWKLVVYSPGITLEESRIQMTKWLSLIGKTESELEKFLGIVEENFLNFNDRDFGEAPNGFIGGWENQNGVHYSVWLDKNWSPDLPLRFCFRVRWLKSRAKNAGSQFYQGPIPPPTGYEDVSMEAPEKWGPDSMADIRKWRGEDIGDGTGPEFKMRPPGWEPGQEETLPLTKREPKQKIVEEKTPEPEKTSSLRWIIAGVLLVGILFLLFKTFKGKSTS